MRATTASRSRQSRAKTSSDERRLTALDLICDVCCGIEPVTAHREDFLLAGLTCECCCGLAAHHCTSVSRTILPLGLLVSKPLCSR